MYIDFVSRRLRKQIEDAKEMKMKYGENRARAVWKRIEQIRAFNNVGDLLQSGIGNVEMLKGNLKGILSIRVDKKLRILFEPIRENRQGDNAIFAADKVRILEVGGYHE